MLCNKAYNHPCLEKKEIDKEMEILDAEIKSMQLKVAEIQEEIAKCDSAIKVDICFSWALKEKTIKRTRMDIECQRS